MVRRFGVFALAALVLMAGGCGPAPSESAAASTPPSPSTAPPVELCQDGAFDPSAYPEVVAAGRAVDSGLTDDVAAYTVGLLPPDLLRRAAVKVAVGDPGNGAPVGLSGDTVLIKPASQVAPAELAYGIVLSATIYVLVSYGAYGREDAEIVGAAAQTTAVDTYIKLAAEHPESTRGGHFPLQGIIGSALARLSGIADRTTEEIDVKQKQQPALFLRELSNFFGHEYYRPKLSYVYQTRLPLPEDRAKRLRDALTAQCA